MQIINKVIIILFRYYSRLLNNKWYGKIPSIINGYKSLEDLVSKIQKTYLSFSSEMDVSQDVNDDMSAADVLERLNDYRFVLDNELIPSLIRSCDAYADFQSDYALTLTNLDEINYRLSMASVIINFALDICEEIKKITIFEGDAWGTLSKIHFAWELKYTNIKSKEVAINEQLHGIQFLEHIFRESNKRQSKAPLLRAYNNMYIYTGEEEWRAKAEQIESLVIN